jgi:putative flippase GtrA
MKKQIKSLAQSFFWFALVGFSAMFVHFYTVTAIFVPLAIHPLIANTLGFLVAFIVSYLGHTYLTFKQPNKKTAPSLSGLFRFFIVATASFLLNQVIFYLLLSFTKLGLDLSLGITLVLVAGVTYLLSKFWAFKISEND